MGFGEGEWEAQMRLTSMPHANGGVSQAMAEGGDKGAVYYDGREGIVGRVKCRGCWCDSSARVAKVVGVI